jgi:hypothetical protein
VAFDDRTIDLFSEHAHPAIDHEVFVFRYSARPSGWRRGDRRKIMWPLL